MKKGDAVAIYMPLVCQLPIAMLACARIGAVHSVVFGGFSAEALAQRIQDCKSRVVLTASGTKRGAKQLGLKQIVDKAIGMTKGSGGFKVEVCLVLDVPAVAKGDCPWVKGRDLWWQEEVASQSTDCKVMIGSMCPSVDTGERQGPLVIFRAGRMMLIYFSMLP